MCIRISMKKQDKTVRKDAPLEQDPNSQAPKRGHTQGDRTRQKGEATTLKRTVARMSKPNPNATKGGGRGRRGTTDNTAG
jgi:hypothetical protein